MISRATYRKRLLFKWFLRSLVINLKNKPKKRIRSSKNQEKRAWIARFELLLLLSVPLLLWLLISPSSDWVEQRYSRGFFAWLASWLVPITNALPFSLGTVLLFVLPLAWLVLLVLTFNRRLFWRWLALSLWRTTMIVLVFATLFVVNWGANYERHTVETQFALSEETVSQADLEKLVSDLMSVVQATVDAPKDEAEAMRSIAVSLEELVLQRTTVAPTLPSKVKRLPKGFLILSGGASGVVSPWTLEPHVDGALPSVAYLAVGAHELAHVAGYASEADADFVGAMAALRAENAYARYATSLSLWDSASRQLPIEKQEAFRMQLPEQAKRDLEAIASVYRSYQLPDLVRRTQTRVYDSYLKTQGVSEGIKDYSRTVDLLISAQKQGLLFDF